MIKKIKETVDQSIEMYKLGPIKLPILIQVPEWTTSLKHIIIKVCTKCIVGSSPIYSRRKEVM